MTWKITNTGACKYKHKRAQRQGVRRPLKTRIPPTRISHLPGENLIYFSPLGMVRISRAEFYRHLIRRRRGVKFNGARLSSPSRKRGERARGPCCPGGKQGNGRNEKSEGENENLERFFPGGTFYPSHTYVFLHVFHVHVSVCAFYAFSLEATALLKLVSPCRELFLPVTVCRLPLSPLRREIVTITV